MFYKKDLSLLLHLFVLFNYLFIWTWTSQFYNHTVTIQYSHYFVVQIVPALAIRSLYRFVTVPFHHVLMFWNTSLHDCNFKMLIILVDESDISLRINSFVSDDKWLSIFSCVCWLFVKYLFKPLPIFYWITYLLILNCSSGLYFSKFIIKFILFLFTLTRCTSYVDLPPSLLPSSLVLSTSHFLIPTFASQCNILTRSGSHLFAPHSLFDFCHFQCLGHYKSHLTVWFVVF